MLIICNLRLNLMLFITIYTINYVNLEVGRRLFLLECQSLILFWGRVISLVWFYFVVFV